MSERKLPGNVKLFDLVNCAIGPHLVYRFGRKLYMRARGDVPNDMRTNGELNVQYGVIDAIPKSNISKLVCFDVGANVGDWTSALLSACEARQLSSFAIYAFEPVPETAEAFRGRIGKRSEVHLEQMAISSSAGSGVIYVGAETAGTNSLYQEGSESRPRQLPIAMTTVSQFCSLRRIESIHLLKCDKEGHDFDVILGALPLMKAGKIAVLQFEYNHRWVFSRHYLKDVFDMISDLPYEVGKICSDHIQVFEKWYPEHERFFEANYVLVRKDALSWFAIRNCSLDSYNTLAVEAR